MRLRWLVDGGVDGFFSFKIWLILSTIALSNFMIPFVASCALYQYSHNGDNPIKSIIQESFILVESLFSFVLVNRIYMGYIYLPSNKTYLGLLLNITVLIIRVALTGFDKSYERKEESSDTESTLYIGVSVLLLICTILWALICEVDIEINFNNSMKSISAICRRLSQRIRGVTSNATAEIKNVNNNNEERTRCKKSVDTTNSIMSSAPSTSSSLPSYTSEGSVLPSYHRNSNSNSSDDNQIPPVYEENEHNNAAAAVVINIPANNN